LNLWFVHDVNLSVDIVDAVLDVNIWEHVPMSTSAADVNFITCGHDGPELLTRLHAVHAARSGWMSTPMLTFYVLSWMLTSKTIHRCKHSL
jgi:hypothetical protein